MTNEDIRARLADALREHRYDGCWCGCQTEVGKGGWPAHVADVLSSLPGIAIVGLPKINSQTGNSWYCNDNSAVWFDNNGGIRIRGAIGGLSEPRKLAATLLAAADKAEQS